MANGTSEDCDGDDTPDECESNFDQTEMIDDCDPDIDNDGVLNDSDPCDFTPPNVPIDSTGRPFGDVSGDCRINLPDLGFYTSCMSFGPGIQHSALCRGSSDFEGDLDIDLGDFSKMQNAFGK